MTHLLVFTPTYADKLQPATVASIVGQQFAGRLTWEIGRYNPHLEPGNANVVAQYQRARELFLAGDYDGLLTVEHDMVIPPSAAQRLWETPAPVVYAPYMLRHGSHVLSAWQYNGDRNLGMSLSLYAKELASYRKAGMGRVSGVGFGCTLIRREVVKRFAFRGDDGSAPDTPFAKDCLQAGILQLARFDVPCGHIDGDRGGEVLEISETTGGGTQATVIGLVDVVTSIEGQSKRLYPKKRYTIPLSVATDLARAGYVQIVTDEGQPGERQTAVNPNAAARSKRATPPKPKPNTDPIA